MTASCRIGRRRLCHRTPACAHQVRRQAAVGILLDAHQVQVLHRVLVGVHAELATQRGELRLAQRRAELGLARQVAAGGLQADADQLRRVIGLHGVVGGHAAIGFLERLHEGLGLRIVEVLRPDAGDVGALRRVAGGLDHARVHREAWHQHRHGLVQARRGVLLDEVDAGAARMELIDGVGRQRPHPRQLDREVRLVQLGVDLGHHLALVGALEALDGVAPGLVVGRQQRHALVAQLVGGHATGRVEGIVLVRGDEIVLVALLAGEAGRTGVQADVERARLDHARRHRRQHVGEVHAGEQLDARLQHAVGRLLGVGRLEAVILDHQLHRHPAQLAAALLDRQVEGVALVLADVAGRRRQRGDEADLDRFGRMRRAPQRPGQARRQHCLLDHCFPLGDRRARRPAARAGISPRPPPPDGAACRCLPRTPPPRRPATAIPAACGPRPRLRACRWR